MTAFDFVLRPHYTLVSASVNRLRDSQPLTSCLQRLFDHPHRVLAVTPNTAQRLPRGSRPVMRVREARAVLRPKADSPSGAHEHVLRRWIPRDACQSRVGLL